MRQFLTVLAAVAIMPVLLSCSAPNVSNEAVSTIYLVRHAEKTTDKTDPDLTNAGFARAEALAKRLSNVGLTHIYSTDTLRTRKTAEPTAGMTGLTIEIYDARDLPGFAAVLKDTPGTHLVVGHSNTTPQLVTALGGEGGAPIVEATEYDRLYRVESVKIGDTYAVRTKLERFGE